MRFITIALRSLGRRPLRSSLTAIGVAVAVGTFIMLVGMSQGAERAWSGGLADRGIHLLGLRRSSVDLMTSALDQQIVFRANEVPGVKAAGELYDLYSLPSGLVIIMTGWAPDSFLWESLSFIRGRAPRPEEEKAVVLGQRLSERLTLNVGDQVPLQDFELEVTGIVRQVSALADNVMILPLATLQQMLRKQGLVAALDLRLERPGDSGEMERVKTRMAEVFPDLDFYETKEAAESNRMFQFVSRLSWSISLTALLMAVFFIANTLLMSVNETTREIAILSALGWSRRLIMSKVFLEGLFVSALGSALGLGLGFAGLHLLATRTQLEGFIEPKVTAAFLIEIFTAGTILGCLGSLYPAWRTTRLNTVEGLRYE